MSPTTLFSTEKRSKLLYGTAALVFCLLIGIGILAKNGWLPHTDSFSGKKTGWFGKELPKNASSSWNPLAPPLPGPTPQLSREYLYSGSRLLAQIDAGAQEAPPADLAIWRPSNGQWWVMGGQGSQQVTYAWGTTGDKPVPGDYDGDGKTDFAVYRGSNQTWYILQSSDGVWNTWVFGNSTGILAPADFDGDGKTDSAYFRPDDPSAGLGSWYIKRSSDGAWYGFQFGVSSDVPAPADYDGDGRADVGVWRSSNQTFYSTNSSNGLLQTSVTGDAGGVVVCADYDGDGKADYAIRNGSTWKIRKSSTGTVDLITPSGHIASDTPVQNDYDGDGKVDIAVWRGTESTSGAGDVGNWYIVKSTGGTRQEHWGASGDIPVPAFYRR